MIRQKKRMIFILNLSPEEQEVGDDTNDETEEERSDHESPVEHEVGDNTNDKNEEKNAVHGIDLKSWTVFRLNMSEINFFGALWWCKIIFQLPLTWWKFPKNITLDKDFSRSSFYNLQLDKLLVKTHRFLDACQAPFFK